ncbi:MAG TPA: 30S ribosomal protein S4 [Patescibacteria group bacterium]|uniref:Small ribosomal subunit protein uS4 n=1 Tax=uncultured Berkelbacteria bacterium Rifle_16ft_4_minimus_38443 TaxID=1665092 RepID=A0A0H4T779_9BACT|nr:30S ribosomal protein S4, small subunit ribosomal protein S4 [uncultured Berkelbacteria bacterium Rifle_16ft_4_minimus_38443]HLC38578.1 30S ribosomal protein S4 [Patescibacteria group bacterium]
MPKVTNNVCEKCRRAGQKLFLKGDKCLSPKCPFTRRSYAPGQHGQVPRRLSEYGRQLREKQKTAQIYGISNQQFKNYYQHALRKKGMTDLALLRLLELRLDNIVFRLGLADSRRQARILVRDGHLEVNGKKVTFPSFQVKIGDKIAPNSASLKKVYFKNRLEVISKIKTPAWLKLKADTMTGEVLKIPERDGIDTPIDEDIVLEFFAR